MQNEQEANRLFKIMSGLTDFKTGRKYDLASCRFFAPLTLEINKLKKEIGTVILAHYYCAPEIVYGVADFRGDSYALSKKAAEAKEDIIIFCGVSFMAQTAKIVNPSKRVFLPALWAGCSLADSVTAQDVVNLKKQYPGVAVICYINSTAEVKAECDICVTSANVYDIVGKTPSETVIFLPDICMAENIKIEMLKRGVKKEIIPFGGTCCVHDKYSVEDVHDIRKNNPLAKVICHPECPSTVCALCDYVGSTGGMLKYVKASEAENFAVLSEDGIVNSLEYENPSKHFINISKTCAQMKRNNLTNLLGILKNASVELEIKVDAGLGLRARKSIDNMFKMAETK